MSDDLHWQDDAALPRYRSSAAARMVNIPVATLRVWERRYRVVGPSQAPSGHRLYSSQDVRRLVLIKQLVDQGNGIGMLARLDTARLQAMVDEVAGVAATLSAPPMAERRAQGLRLLLLGSGFTPRHVQALQGVPGAQIVAHLGDGADTELAARGLQADAVLVEIGALHMDTAQRLWRLARVVGARHQIVVYGFANTQVLESLRVRSAVLRRAPMAPDEWAALLTEELRSWQSLAEVAPSVAQLAPPPRFDADALDALTQAMPRVACECPQHLAQLITLLGQFETYSADCESRQPADVALHAYLFRVAGQARALMEEALVTVARAEGVSLPVRASAVASGDVLSAESGSPAREPVVS